VIHRTRARKLWVPLDGFRFLPPRLVQLWHICVCSVIGHRFGAWRRETEDWFEELPGPEPWAWRACRRCGCIEDVRQGRSA